jgi:hypothetical protein
MLGSLSLSAVCISLASDVKDKAACLQAAAVVVGAATVGVGRELF